MNWELKRVEPLRAANVGALVYCVMTTVFAILFAPIILLVSIFGPDQNIVWGLMMLILYPFIGLIMGWISGLVTAAAYNVVIRVTGGLQFTVEASGSASHTMAP